MANISSLGIGSGIDSETIITKLMAVENQPVSRVKDENSKLSTKLSTWGRVQSSFAALKDASAALSADALWNNTVATSSDDKAVSVTTGTGSVAGSYAIGVTQLAQAQFVASPTFADKSFTPGSGTLQIDIGRYSNDNPNATPPPPAVSFAARDAASAQGISIQVSSTDTMESIRDKINQAAGGVTASLVTDATGTRLVLRGGSGQDSAFRVQVTPDAPATAGTFSLGDLAYDGSDGAVNTSVRTQEASNAQATINGVAVSSETNTFSNVMDGMTIKVGQVTTNPVNVAVSNDTDGMTKGVNAFVSAYNDLVGLIRVQTLYDENSKTGGPLQGDSTARGLLGQLRNLASSSTTATSAFSRLSEIGLTANVDGTLKVDAGKLSKAMENRTQLQAFFGTTDTTDPTREGLAERFRKMSDQVASSEGTIKTRTTGLQGNIKRNEDKITRLEERNTLVEARLRAQYTALDQSMNKLSGLSSYVTQQLTALNNRNN